MKKVVLWGVLIIGYASFFLSFVYHGYEVYVSMGVCALILALTITYEIGKAFVGLLEQQRKKKT